MKKITIMLVAALLIVMVSACGIQKADPTETPGLSPATSAPITVTPAPHETAAPSLCTAPSTAPSSTPLPIPEPSGGNAKADPKPSPAPTPTKPAPASTPVPPASTSNPTPAPTPLSSPPPASTPQPTPAPVPSPSPTPAPAQYEYRTICNTCGEDITGNVAEHGTYHLLRNENFSYSVIAVPIG